MKLLWFALLLSLAFPVLGEEPVHPLLPADTSSPRATLDSFMENCEVAYALLRTEGRERDSEASRAASKDVVRRIMRCMDLSEIAEFRRDNAAKRWASSFANGVRRRLLNDGAVDTGCGLKVFYREAFLRLPYFDHMHRYLPALMRREGFLIEFLPVSHRPRVHGVSKYTNFGRFLVALRDLLGVLWLLARSKSPKSISEHRE